MASAARSPASAQDGRVLVAEAPGEERADVQRAHHPVACAQRDAEQRGDARPQRMRARRLGGGVVDRHRGALGGDACGEAGRGQRPALLAHRRDPARRLEHGRVSLVLVQEHRGGVDPQHVDDPLQQLAQQLVEVG